MRQKSYGRLRPLRHRLRGFAPALLSLLVACSADEQQGSAPSAVSAGAAGAGGKPSASGQGGIAGNSGHAGAGGSQAGRSGGSQGPGGASGGGGPAGQGGGGAASGAGGAQAGGQGASAGEGGSSGQGGAGGAGAGAGQGGQGAGPSCGASEQCWNLGDDDCDGKVVALGSDGHLLYTPDARGNRLVDFSHAGYRGGGEAIPKVAVKAVVSPGVGDPWKAIQDAIDKVSAEPLGADGFRGRCC